MLDLIPRVHRVVPPPPPAPTTRRSLTSSRKRTAEVKGDCFFLSVAVGLEILENKKNKTPSKRRPPEDYQPKGRMQACARMQASAEFKKKGAQARYKATDDDIKLVASAGNPTSTPQVLAFLANVSVNLMVYKLVDTTWTLYSVNPRGSRTIWVRLAEQHYRLLKPHPHKEPEISMLTAKAFKLPEGPTVLQGSGAPSSRGRESALMRDCRRSMGLGSDRTSGSAHVDSEMCAVLGFQKQADDTDLDIDNGIPMNQFSKAKPLQYLTCPCGDFEPTFE